MKRPKLDGFTGIIDGWLEGDRAASYTTSWGTTRVDQIDQPGPKEIVLLGRARAMLHGRTGFAGF